MIITLDLDSRHILHKGKKIDVDPIFAFSMAPKGTVIEVIENQANQVTLKLSIPDDAYKL